MFFSGGATAKGGLLFCQSWTGLDPGGEGPIQRRRAHGDST